MNNQLVARVVTVMKSDWGDHLKAAADRLAPTVILLITICVLIFDAGRLTRQILHVASEALAAAMAMAQGMDEQHHRDQVAGIISFMSAMAFATVDYFEQLINTEPVPPLAAVATPPKPPAKPPVKKGGNWG